MVEYIAIAVVVIVLLVVVILAAKRRCGSMKNGCGSSHKGHSQSGYSGPANTQLYVGNLSYRASDSELRDFFSTFGEIDTIRVIKDRRTGRSKGFAFITYVNLEGATEALTAHEQDFMGRALIVRYAKPAGNE